MVVSVRQVIGDTENEVELVLVQHVVEHRRGVLDGGDPALGVSLEKGGVQLGKNRIAAHRHDPDVQRGLQRRQRVGLRFKGAVMLHKPLGLFVQHLAAARHRNVVVVALE